MEKSKFEQFLNGVEETDTHHIVRAFAFGLYLELVLQYFFGTSLLNFTKTTLVYEFISANWIKLLVVWFAYNPIQRVGKWVAIILGQLTFDISWRLRKRERTEYEKLERDEHIISLETAYEVARRFSDARFEKKIEQKEESARNAAVVVMRVGVVFALLLVNSLLFWTGKSSIGLIWGSSALQITVMAGCVFWIVWLDSEDYEYVSKPRYLKRQVIEEIEKELSTQFHYEKGELPYSMTAVRETDNSLIQ